MGFNINKIIVTELHYEDIALIAVALGDYQRNYKDTAEPEILIQAARLINRLGTEMYDCKQDKD